MAAGVAQVPLASVRIHRCMMYKRRVLGTLVEISLAAFAGIHPRGDPIVDSTDDDDDVRPAATARAPLVYNSTWPTMAPSAV